MFLAGGTPSPECDPYSSFYNQALCFGQDSSQGLLQNPVQDSGFPWSNVVFFFVLTIILIVLLLSTAKIVKQYERGVVYTLGRVNLGREARKPGLNFIMPLIQRMDKVMMAVVALELDPQEVITKDNVSLAIGAVVYFKVADPIKAEVEVESFQDAIELRAQTVLRQVIGGTPLEDVLAHSAGVAQSIKDQIAAAAASWGLDVQNVELKDVKLPDSMSRAMAAQAEATREAAAKIIAAQGELDSAALLAEAASLLNPGALRLRELQTIREIGTENNTVIVMDSQSGAVAAQAAAGNIAAQDTIR